MSEFVEELKSEHATILDLLTQLKEAGLASPKAQDKLLSAKTYILAHLEKEDRKLYPPLEKASKSNDDLKMTLDIFANNTKKVSDVVNNFFEKYHQGELSGEFAKDFGRLLFSVRSRIEKEEKMIFVEYENLIG